MIKNGRAYTLKSENGLGDETLLVTDGSIYNDDPAKFMAMVFGWIYYHISPASRTDTLHSSYALKHMAERDIRCYVSNNQFKDAMLLCGYRPVKADETNWLFKIKLHRDESGWNSSVNPQKTKIIEKPGKKAFLDWLEKADKEEAQKEREEVNNG